MTDTGGNGICGGALSIVNAIATGFGSAFGIGLSTKASVTLHKSDNFNLIVNGKNADTRYLKEIFHEAKREYKNDLSEYHGITTETVSNIPQSMGLKSSSAAANAILLGITDALNIPINREKIAVIGAKAAIKSGVSITGAYDDALACILGGVVFTDNKKMKLLKRETLPPLKAAIVIPDFTIPTCSFPREKFQALSDKSYVIFQEAMNGNIFSAMYENGKLVSEVLDMSTEIQDTAIKCGATSAGISGTGPACGILISPEKFSQFMESFPYHVITTEIRNQSEI